MYVTYFRALEKDLEDERLRDEERERQRLDERNRTLELQMKEREEKKKEEIGKMNVAEEEKDRLMKEHEANQAR